MRDKISDFDPNFDRIASLRGDGVNGAFDRHVDRLLPDLAGTGRFSTGAGNPAGVVNSGVAAAAVATNGPISQQTLNARLEGIRGPQVG